MKSYWNTFQGIIIWCLWWQRISHHPQRNSVVKQEPKMAMELVNCSMNLEVKVNFWDHQPILYSLPLLTFSHSTYLWFDKMWKILRLPLICLERCATGVLPGGGQFAGDEETPFLFFAQRIFLCLTNQSRRDIAISFVGLLCTEICLKTDIALVPKRSKWLCHFDGGDSFLWLYQAPLE